MTTRALIGQLGTDGNAHLHYVHMNGMLGAMLPTLATLTQRLGSLHAVRDELFSKRYSWDVLDADQMDYAAVDINPEWQSAPYGSQEQAAWQWAHYGKSEHQEPVAGIGCRRRALDRTLTVAEVDRDEQRLDLRADMIGWSYLLLDDSIEVYRALGRLDDGHELIYTITAQDLARSWSDDDVEALLARIRSEVPGGEADLAIA